jgi:hypothetical protein
MSAFDVSVYENAVIEGSSETKAVPIPEGAYQGIVDKVRIKAIKVDGAEKPVLEVIYELTNTSEDLKKLLNRDKILVRQDLWLDLTEQGAVAMGPNQNLGLGRLREACNMNDAKRKFAFKMLEGQGPLKLHVKNKTNADTGDTFSNITKVEKWA